MNIYDMVSHYSVQGFFHMEMEKQDALENKIFDLVTSHTNIEIRHSRLITIKINIHTTMSHQHQK